MFITNTKTTAENLKKNDQFKLAGTVFIVTHVDGPHYSREWLELSIANRSLPGPLQLMQVRNDTKMKVRRK